MSTTKKQAMKNIVSLLDYGLLKAEEYVLSFSVIALAIMHILNVVVRTFFNSSIVFSEEISQALMVTITFLGLGYAARKSRHIRMTALYEWANPDLKKIMLVIISLGTFIFATVLAYWSFIYILAVKESGFRTDMLHIPLYLIYFTAPIGFFICAGEYFLTLCKNLTNKKLYLSTEVIEKV